MSMSKTEAFVKMMLVVVVTVVVPLAVLLGIWAGFIPQAVQIGIGITATILSILYIVGGNLYCIYGDIKTKRYSK